MKIQNEKLQITLEVEIACTEPENFINQKDFQKEDLSAMKKYLAEKLERILVGSWQYAAKVVRVKVLSGTPLTKEQIKIYKSVMENFPGTSPEEAKAIAIRGAIK